MWQPLGYEVPPILPVPSESEGVMFKGRLFGKNAMFWRNYVDFEIILIKIISACWTELLFGSHVTHTLISQFREAASE